MDDDQDVKLDQWQEEGVTMPALIFDPETQTLTEGQRLVKRNTPTPTLCP
jgi:hypothetical protein